MLITIQYLPNMDPAMAPSSASKHCAAPARGDAVGRKLIHFVVFVVLNRALISALI